jgi:hypothetical protein
MSERPASAPTPPRQRGGGAPPAEPDEVEADQRVSRPVRGALRSRQEARRAIVLREVLGPPVALRRATSDVPGLSP